MKEIKLTRGAVALVDDEDFEMLNRHKWYQHSTGYAVREKRIGPIRHIFWLHRQVFPTKSEIDHIDGNRLNNQKANLRGCTHRQNMANRWKNKEPGLTSRFKGVSWAADKRKWLASTSKNSKTIYLGRYDREEDAARAHDNFARQEFGEFARLNFVQ